jgi:hypothetical protein
LRNSDFHPISESLRLRDNRVVEIAELDYRVLELSQLSASVFGSTPPRMITAGVPQLASNSLELELDVIRRLDEANAFLGEQIAVERTRGAVVVQGVVDGTQRKNEILQALGPDLHNSAVRLEIVVPGGGRNRVAPETDRRVSIEGIETLQKAPADTSLRAYFSKNAGSSGEPDEAVEHFTNEVSLHSQSARAHALALKQIAERFSPDDLNAMTADEHRQWRAMLNGHARVMLEETRAIQDKLEPIFRTNSEDKPALITNFKSDADIVDAAARLSDLAAANDNAVWHSFAASTQASDVTRVCLPEFWESLLDAEILAREISARTTD